MDALLRFCGAKLVAIVPEDWRNAFVIIMGIRYIGVILHTFYYNWGEKCPSL